QRAARRRPPLLLPVRGRAGLVQEAGTPPRADLLHPHAARLGLEDALHLELGSDPTRERLPAARGGSGPALRGRALPAVLRAHRDRGAHLMARSASNDPGYPFPEALTLLPRDTSSVVEASAGTGKTFLLEHLVADRILRGEARLEEILVVTFTEKATA